MAFSPFSQSATGFGMTRKSYGKKNGPMMAMRMIEKNRIVPKTASLWRLNRRQAICHWLSETRLTSKSSPADGRRAGLPRSGQDGRTDPPR